MMLGREQFIGHIVERKLGSLLCYAQAGPSVDENSHKRR